MIFVDSNLFVIDLRYASDATYRINRRALDRVGRRTSGITSVLNVLLTAFLSWNATHFAGKLAVPALTPREWLSRRRRSPQR